VELRELDRLRAAAADATAASQRGEGQVVQLQDDLRRTKAQLADALSELDTAQHEVEPLRRCALAPPCF
jgi:predicted  nucleic acid-binding Zn-ribbon protein